jgi:Tfp pilus assembly protein PilV
MVPELQWMTFVHRSTDSGSTLIEVLLSTAVASVTLAGAVGLLATSARAVADSELETTATWVASRTLEEWRSTASPVLDGRHQVGLLEVVWTAQPEPGSVGLWRVSVSVSSPRLRQEIAAQAVVSRRTP